MKSLTNRNGKAMNASVKFLTSIMFITLAACLTQDADSTNQLNAYY